MFAVICFPGNSWCCALYMYRDDIDDTLVILLEALI